MALDQMKSMNFDDQVRRYFSISNLAAVPPEVLDAGVERMKVDLGLTKDRVSGSHSGRCCTRWNPLRIWMPYSRPKQREAARNFMNLIEGRVMRSLPPPPS
jgi:hypothetical protein